MRKAIFAGTLLATALSGATTFGALNALPASASAGCGVTVHVHNQTKSPITVQWNQSDSRAKWVFAGPWAKLGSGSTTISAGATGSQAFTLDFSCSTDHQYRVHYTQGSNSAYGYFPANTSNWTNSNSPNVNVK
jgi:hypothetical protein